MIQSFLELPFQPNQVIHGDCIDVMQSLPDQSIDAVITDPPFNATVTGKQVTVKDKSFATIDEDWNLGFTLDWLDCVPRLIKPSGSLIVFCTFHLLRDYLNYFHDNPSWTFRQILHWKKTNPFPSIRPYYTFSIEYILWYTRNYDVGIDVNTDTNVRSTTPAYTFNIDAAKKWFKYDTYDKDKNGFAIPATKFRKHDLFFSSICTGHERTTHPSQKPLSLMKALVDIHTNVNDVILEPFGGSGTTAVACQELNRNFICIERDASYVEIAKERLYQNSLPLLT